MVTTRCKFFVSGVKTTSSPGVETDNPTGATIYLSAVYSSDINNENHLFHKATPSGSMDFTVYDQNGIGPLLEIFKPGRMFYLDLTEAPKPEPAKV